MKVNYENYEFNKELGFSIKLDETKFYVDEIFKKIKDTHKNVKANSFEINLNETLKMNVIYNNKAYIGLYKTSCIYFIKKIQVIYKNIKCNIYNCNMLESYITNIMESKVNKIQIVEKNTKKLIKSSDLFSLDFNNIF